MSQPIACPACHSTDTHTLPELHKLGTSPQHDTAPPRKRTSPRVKLLYAAVLLASWSIIPMSIVYFVSVSYMRYHLEMQWIVKFSALQLSIPAIVLIVCLIASLRYLWVRCTAIIDAETRWNSDVYPGALEAWRRTRVCAQCGHRWVN